ncbi:MAG: DNA ligase D [Acidobacteria bacterium]|nr:DNA ligase D [Acidobacteriota bacterium]
MTLKKYRDKRKFQETPEPEGSAREGRGPLRFVVQLHQASRLHFDFRLELDGTLKSWAVPKGPSLDPQERRLAVMVEDHPLEYESFEGIIPKGNYGAGTVMVWDNGTYYSRQTPDGEESEKVLRDGLKKGHITFILEGKKLKGEFALVKLKRGEENAWLLLKKGDAFAARKDILEFDRSVLSNRNLDEIAKQAPALQEVWHGKPKRPLPDLGDAVPSKILRQLEPMLATPVSRPFDRAGWLFEIKWDGYRAIAEIEGGRVRLYSRNQLSLEERFAPLMTSLQRFGHDAVLDGEVVVLDESGKPRFQLLQDYQKSRRGHLVYCVFDLLYLAGHDLRKLPLRRRKEILKQVILSEAQLVFSDHVEEHGTEFFNLVTHQGLEGMVAKDASSPYLSGRRSMAWLKIKIEQRQEAVIGGFTMPGGGRKHFGALLLGVYKGKELVYVGHVGTGFSEKLLRDIGAELEPLIQSACPFKKQPPANAPVRWVKPKLVCEVSFREWTQDKVMRHPVFLGIRKDRSAASVRLETPQTLPGSTAVDENNGRPWDNVGLQRSGQSKPRKPPANPLPVQGGGNLIAPSLTRNAGAISVDGQTVKLTNLNKVYWPEEGFTKRDLIAYYHEMASFILPYLKDRPQSLNRHPNGIHGESFYQKDVEHHPEWVKTVKVRSESQDKEIRFLLCQDAATLVYMANLGCIEINPWSSRIGMLDQPDFLVIDLDPEDILFDAVVDAALAVRKILDAAGAKSYCKTSGKTGLHVYAPLGGCCSYEQARQFAEIIARLAHRELPKLSSLERNPAKRQKKVYLDFLQNRRGQTLAAPYSLRPHPGATVSTPLRWEEIKRGLDPSQFTIRTIRKRLEKAGDLWAPVLSGTIDLAKCLQRLG